MTIQAQVLALLARLQQESGLGMIFVTHSLPVAAEIAGRIAVMYAGEIVEEGPTKAVFASPLHPYTRALLRSALADDGGLPHAIPGAMPPPYALPPGCLFAPRCEHRVDACEARRPKAIAVQEGRMTRCLRWAEI
ncbi:MAG: hypothetical protein M3Y41_03350 [Pseudomonadota bacterium]|nr:hypothetical protein [Pseudomonadota bacterium]